MSGNREQDRSTYPIFPITIRGIRRELVDKREDNPEGEWDVVCWDRYQKDGSIVHAYSVPAFIASTGNLSEMITRATICLGAAERLGQDCRNFTLERLTEKDAQEKKIIAGVTRIHIISRD